MRFALLVGIATISSLGFASAELVKGTIFSVKGDVKMVTASGETITVTSKTPVTVGSKIETGADGQLAIVWMDGARCVLDKNTTLSVDSLQLTEDSGKINRKIVLRLANGTIVDEMATGGNSVYRVKTEGGDFITNGTQNLISFTKSVSGKSAIYDADLVVLSGQVEAQLADGTTTDTTSYHETTFTVGDAPQKVVMNDDFNSQFGAVFCSKPQSKTVDNSNSGIEKIKNFLAQFGSSNNGNGNTDNNGFPTDVGSSPDLGGGTGFGGNGSGGGNFGSSPSSAGAGPSTTGSTPVNSSTFSNTNGMNISSSTTSPTQ